MTAAPCSSTRSVCRCIPLAAQAVVAFCLSGYVHAAGDVNERRLTDAGETAQNWLVNGGNGRADHYSPLRGVNRDTIGDLGLRWFTDIPMPDGIAGTPIEVDGVVYLSTAWSHVYALDAENGKILWHHRPGVEEATQLRPRLSWAARANRGVAVWEGRVYVATADCRLVAINAATGQEDWTVQSCDPDAGYSITDAPRVGGGKVYLGNGGSESTLKNRGYMSAYDAANGKLAWRFYVVPSDDPGENTSQAMKMAAKTWDGDTLAKYGGGGNPWNEMTYDPESGLLIFGTSGSYPYEHRKRSPGGLDNLFLSSVVAVDAETGEYAWHYQTVPQESWDYNATMNIVLAKLPIDGEPRDVAMIAPKNGFFYVLDKHTGELLSAGQFAKVNWATHINMETGRPVLDPAASYWEHEAGASIPVWPNMWGAHSWQPMAFNPQTALAYVPVADIPELVTMGDGGEWNSDPVLVTEVDGKPHAPGRLLAWDPVEQAARWSVEQDRPFNGGLLTTGGGLVFQGDAMGYLSAYDADDGERLWAVNTGSPVNSAPITFLDDGRQVVLVAIGAGGGMQFGYPELHGGGSGVGSSTRVLAFDLGGNRPVPKAAAPVKVLPDLPDERMPPDQVALGETLYHDNCGYCHGRHLAARPGGSVPDLRYASRETHLAWPGIVVGGALRARGMPAFELSAEEAEAIRLFVLSQRRSAGTD